MSLNKKMYILGGVSMASTMLMSACDAGSSEDVSLEISVDEIELCEQDNKEEEPYIFSRMSEFIQQDPKLEKELGFSEVESCEQAKKAEKVLDEPSLDEDDVEFSQQSILPASLDQENDFRILDGDSSSREGVLYIDADQDSLECSAVMISKYHALTSASCLGKHLRRRGENGRYTRFRIRHAKNTGGFFQDALAFFHPSYSKHADRSHDIAVLSFRNALNIRPRRMHAGPTKIGKQLDIYGWGTNKSNGGVRRKLRKGKDDAKIRIHSHRSGYFRANAASARICQGDQGGPAMDVTGRHPIVWGIADSWNSQGSCPTKGAPMYWTKTNVNLSWIEKTLGEDARMGRNFKCNRFTGSDGLYFRCF